MNGVESSGYSFIDSLHFEYVFNQTLLVNHGQKRSNPPDAAASNSRLPKLFKETVSSKRDMEIHQKLFQKNQSLLVHISPDQRVLTRGVRPMERVGLFTWYQNDSWKEKIEVALAAFDQRVAVALNSNESYQHQRVLCELHMQALINSRAGLHLLIIPQDQRTAVLERLTIAYWEGVETVFRVLIQETALHGQLLTKAISLLLQSFQWRKPTEVKKYDYETIGTLLRIISLFPRELLLKKVLATGRLVNQESISKVRVATVAHIRRNQSAKDFRAKVIALIDQTLALVTDRENIARRSFVKDLQMVKSAILNSNAELSSFFSIFLQQCQGMHLYYGRDDINGAYYFLTSGICSITCEERSLKPTQEYASTENLIDFLNACPHTISTTLGAWDQHSSQSKTYITTPDTLGLFTEQDFEKLLQKPIRSLYFYGYDSSLKQEWNRMYLLTPKLVEQIKQRYPGEPAPFRAIFSEQATDFTTGF